jgi:hypothetical protein
MDWDQAAETMRVFNVRVKLEGQTGYIMHMKSRDVDMSGLFASHEYKHLGDACIGDVRTVSCFVRLNKTNTGLKTAELGYLPCEAMKDSNWLVVPEDRPPRDGIYSWLDRRGLLKTKTDTEYDNLKAQWVTFCNQYKN